MAQTAPVTRVLPRGLKRGDVFKAYGTTKLWEIIVSMELNDR
jgi:hypothetical protein